jgi:hypothetical protein
MRTAIHREWDNVKDEAILKKYYQFVLKDSQYIMEKIQEGIVKNVQGWTDGTGHIEHLIEFDDAEAFAKFWSDEEWQLLQIEFFPLINNFKIRIMRSVMLPKNIE